MSRIVVIGGTGYAGSNVVARAVARGHQVTSLSRNLPEGQVEGATYRTGNVTDHATLAGAVQGADVVVSALSPRGELDGRILDVDRELAALACDHGVRLYVVGGFSSLRRTENDAPAAESGQVPKEFAAEALQMHSVLTHLKTEPEGLDWVFFSPAAAFGSFAPGEDLGRYRVGGEVALLDEQGGSSISGADFARAIVDRIESDDYHRAHIGIAY